MTTPTLVIVPGLWLGPYPYQKWADETLTKMEPSLKGNIFYAPLASTGTRSPGAPNMTDDATAIRKVIQPLVEAGKKVVVIGHSSGAFLSAMSTEDLEVGQKLAVPHGGGVEKFIFIAGGLLPVGAPHPPTNWEAKASVPQHLGRTPTDKGNPDYRMAQPPLKMLMTRCFLTLIPILRRHAKSR